jgi:hypothetical protein
MIYQLYKSNPKAFEPDAAYYIDEQGRMISFAFDPANTDYQTFKKDLANGASLKDAEGNDMTAEQITTFLGTLK